MLGALLLACLAGAPAQAAFPGENGKIVFSSDTGGIWEMNGDGSNARPVTTTTDNPATSGTREGDYEPVFSPESTTIAFKRRVTFSRDEIWVRAGAGSERSLTRPFHPENVDSSAEPAFSPDGRTIAYSEGAILLIDAFTVTTTRPEAVPNTSEFGFSSSQPAFSPDGSKIAFMGLRRDPPGSPTFREDIYVIGTDGSSRTRLTNDPVRAGWPSFSPDGRRIAFQSERDGNVEVYVMNADGSGQRRLTDNPARDAEPVFSPDGTKIAFHSNRDGNNDVWVMQADGSGVPTNLTKLPVGATSIGERSPDWGRVPGSAPPPPAASIGDVSVGEGDSGQTAASFTVSLSSASASEVKVDFATANDTATAPADYEPGTGTVTFAPGETTKTVTVQVKGDTLDEADERLLANLSNPQGASVGDGQGVATIVDDDPVPAASIGDSSVSEGDSGQVDATFTVSLSAASGRQVVVDFATADDSATAPTDYEPRTGTVTFAAAETTKTVTVRVEGDTLTEPNEQFFVNLSNPQSATVADGQGAGTIVDNDAPAGAGPRVSIGDASVAEGDSGQTPASFTVSLSAASAAEVKVDFATTNDSATAPADFDSRAGTVTFAPGETTKTVTVQVKGDALDEPDERFLVNLSNPSNASVGDGQGVGTITDDDGVPAASVGDSSVSEGDSGEVDATFTISLSAASARQVAVDYATADQSATAPADYEPKSGTVTFAAGETAKTVTVPVRGDTLDEPDERFLVNLSSPQSATLADGQGAGTIVDNDRAPAASIGDTAVSEGNSGEAEATFTVSLSAASGRQVAVDYATANDSATAPADYTAGAGTVSFAPGETTKTVTVQVKGDALDEPDERFLVNLSNPSNASVGDGEGVGTITDDDGVPAASVGDSSVSEGDSGEAEATFTVSLSAASGRQVTVDYATANDSAGAPNDYTQKSGTVTFAAGEMTKTVTVQVKGDTLDEPDERFLVNLPEAQNATLADAQGAGTITDDDVPPALAIGDASVSEGNSGEVDATFTVSLSAASGRQVTVDYATVNDTATAPADYTQKADTATFAAGETTSTVTVKVKGDSSDEPDERFLVNLSNPQNASIADGQGAGTIKDDDPPQAGGGPGGRDPGGDNPGGGGPGGGDNPGQRGRGCLNYSAGVHGKRLGQARLGRSRKAHRRSFKGAKLRARRGIDRYCIAGGGALRIGYPTRRLMRTLARPARRRLRNRALVILTSSRRYSIRGIRPRTSTRTLTRRLRSERRLRLGRNVWYLARARGSRLAFKTRAGRVLEIGLANPRLTRSRRTAKLLLGGF